MVMTVDEAKTKWCPHSRNAVVITREPPVAVTANRDTSEHYGVGEVTCLADGCMAWRWKPLMCDDAWTDAVRKAAEELGDKSHNRAKAAAHVNANRAQYGLPVKPFLGYCGLAGRPE